jgi:hypothetical protein
MMERFIDVRRNKTFTPVVVEVTIGSVSLSMTEAEIRALYQKVDALVNPRGACGVRSHHAECDCNGEAGDR